MHPPTNATPLTAPAPASQAVATRFNPLLPEFVVDPHPQLHRLRAEDPVHYSSAIGVWILTRYADVHMALRDPRFSCAAGNWEHYEKFFLRGGSRTSPMAEMYSKWMLQTDPPDHTRLRGLVNKAFTPRVVETMRPRIQRIVDDLIDKVALSGSIEIMSDIAFPLPILVISDLLGVPREDYEKIRVWSEGLLPSLSPAISAAGVARVNETIIAYREYFRDLANQRRREPKEDMLTALIFASEQGDKLTEDELLATCILISFAGHATTAQLTGKAMLELMTHRAEFEKLRADPSLIDGAIEEVCRFESPLQILFRTTKADVQIDDKVIPARKMVFLSLAAANRDPAQFPEPDLFDITRSPNKHVAFAHGIHFCVGAPLARLEGQIAVNTILRRLPELSCDPQGVKRESSLLLRGLRQLPATFKACGKEQGQAA